jgi:DNA-binding IclR family transcriptional regulator
VRDRSGYVIGAVGIEGSVDAICDTHLGPRRPLAKHVMEAGRSISHELGHGRHG